MPNLMTHKYFARDVLKKRNEKVNEKIREY